MKGTLLALIFFSSIFFSKGQVLVSANFDTYDGTTTMVPAGFYISWNSTSSPSYYTSPSTSCGVACNAYKFGVDSATIITPTFSLADSVRFMMKGNGMWRPNKFKVFGSSDSTNWVLIHSYDSIPLAKLYYSLPVNSSYTNLMFYYEKDSSGLTVGFDDLYVFRGSLSIGIQEFSKSSISIYPNPSNGFLNIQMNNVTIQNVTVSVTNILGKVINVYSYNELNGLNALDLSGIEEGIYIIRIKSDKTDIFQRVLIKK